MLRWRQEREERRAALARQEAEAADNGSLLDEYSLADTVEPIEVPETFTQRTRPRRRIKIDMADWAGRIFFTAIYHQYNKLALQDLTSVMTNSTIRSGQLYVRHEQHGDTDAYTHSNNFLFSEGVDNMRMIGSMLFTPIVHQSQAATGNLAFTRCSVSVSNGKPEDLDAKLNVTGLMMPNVPKALNIFWSAEIMDRTITLAAENVGKENA